MTRARSLHAARYLRALATIETLSALGNDAEVRRLLAGLDPLEARALARELETSGKELAGSDSRKATARPVTVYAGRSFPDEPSPLVSPQSGAVRGIRSGRGLLAAPVPKVRCG